MTYKQIIKRLESISQQIHLLKDEINVAEKEFISVEEIKIEDFTFVHKVNINNVSEITLLSEEEWEKAKEIKSVPKYASWWWLRSPGYFSNYATDVGYKGNISNYGDCVSDISGSVRPAFRVPNLKSEIGSKIFVGNTLCTVIDTDYALSDTVVYQHRFDEKSNDYDKSEIKQIINSYEFKEML